MKYLLLHLLISHCIAQTASKIHRNWNLTIDTPSDSARLFTCIQAGTKNDPTEAFDAAVDSNTTLLLALGFPGIKKEVTGWGKEANKEMIGVGENVKNKWTGLGKGINNRVTGWKTGATKEVTGWGKEANKEMIGVGENVKNKVTGWAKWIWGRGVYNEMTTRGEDTKNETTAWENGIDNEMTALGKGISKHGRKLSDLIVGISVNVYDTEKSGETGLRAVVIEQAIDQVKGNIAASDFAQHMKDKSIDHFDTTGKNFQRSLEEASERASSLPIQTAEIDQPISSSSPNSSTMSSSLSNTPSIGQSTVYSTLATKTIVQNALPTKPSKKRPSTHVLHSRTRVHRPWK